MKKITMYLGMLALGLVIVPPTLYMLHSMKNLDQVKLLMLVGTVVWFVTAPLWMKKEE